MRNPYSKSIFEYFPCPHSHPQFSLKDTMLPALTAQFENARFKTTGELKCKKKSITGVNVNLHGTLCYTIPKGIIWKWVSKVIGVTLLGQRLFRGKIYDTYNLKTYYSNTRKINHKYFLHLHQSLDIRKILVAYFHKNPFRILNHMSTIRILPDQFDPLELY